MAFKKASQSIGTNKRRKSIKIVIILYQNQISNAAKHSRPCRDANLIYIIKIMIDCMFLIICKHLIMFSILRFGGTAVKAISKLSFVNMDISDCTSDIMLVKMLKSIVG